MLIIHRCRKCHKPDIWTRRDGSTTTSAGLTCRYSETASEMNVCNGKTWGPPELLRRWKYGTTEEIIDIQPPGGRSDTISVTTCDCYDCIAFYEEQTMTTWQNPRMETPA